VPRSGDAKKKGHPGARDDAGIAITKKKKKKKEIAWERRDRTEKEGEAPLPF